MRWVQVEDGLSLRFPARDAAFHEGVELGILAALLNAGHGRQSREAAAAADRRLIPVIHAFGRGCAQPSSIAAYSGWRAA